MTLNLVPELVKKYYSVFSLLFLWELAAKARLVDNFLLPPLSLVLAKMAETIVFGNLLSDSGSTLYRAGISFVGAIILGVPLGMIMAKVRAIRWFFDPVISVGFPTPVISFLPIFMLWFGLFDLPKIVLATLACIFPVVSATFLGALTVDKYLLWSARNMGTRGFGLLFKVVFPAILPQALNGIQVALPVSLIVSIVAEMLLGGSGLGSFIMISSRLAETASVFVGIISLSVIGYSSMKLLEFCRRTILAWHEEALPRR